MNVATDGLRHEAELDLGELLRVLWSRRFLLTGIVIIFMALAIVAAFTITPIYRSQALLVPADVEGSGMGSLLGGLGDLGGLAALAGVDISGNRSATEESLAVLRSREFTEAFIRDRDLLPVLFDRAWDADRKQWRDPEDPPTMAEGYKYFNQTVRGVAQDTRTGLVTLRIDWRDPQVSADWVNELVQRLNAEMRRRAIERTNASVEYLEKELENTVLVDTRSAISRLMETQINQRMLANVTAEYAFRVVDRALPPDDDDPVRPRKLLMVAAAAAAGLLLGLVIVLATRRWRR